MSDKYKFLLAIVVTLFLTYLAAIFVSLEPNPLAWTEGGRFAAVTLAPMFALFIALCPAWYD